MESLLKSILEPTVDAMVQILTVLALGAASQFNYGPKQVAEAELDVPFYEPIRIESADKFLNDLMLSPHWGVTRDRKGNYIANPRSMKNALGSYRAHGYTFLNADENSLGMDARWSTKIIFTQPREGSKTIEPGTTIELPIYDHSKSKIGLNSFSNLAVRLSDDSDIYLTIRESGKDTKRETTSRCLPLVLNELRSIVELPKRYETSKVYAEFYATYFETTDPESGLRRTEGIQGRDNFYGYFRYEPGQNYEGINIKISHPVYCPDEGTRKSRRLQKAEFVGRPYVENDLLFYLITDNAVYLSGEYDRRFGVFSGEETFEGKIEILNLDQDILLESSGQFTSWQR